jgi:hypothetical protein
MFHAESIHLLSLAIQDTTVQPLNEYIEKAVYMIETI